MVSPEYVMVSPEYVGDRYGVPGIWVRFPENAPGAERTASRGRA